MDKSLLSKYYILYKNHPGVDPIERELYPNLCLHETNLHLSRLLPTSDVVLSSINTAAAIESFAKVLSREVGNYKILEENSIYYEMIGNTQKDCFDLDKKFSLKLTDLSKANSFWFKNYFKEN